VKVGDEEIIFRKTGNNDTNITVKRIKNVEAKRQLK
jgi:hypothetical protein